jgi:branched-chain amino acid transport system substrate-binding protein
MRAIGNHIYFWACIFMLMPAFMLFGAQYDNGASDTEIRIGNTTPLSGPLQATSHLFIKATTAYIDKINKEEGGVNGRKIVFISKDDAFDPVKTVQLTRELIENDKVLFMALSTGTAANLATRDYLNQRKIPQLFIRTGAEIFYDPVKTPLILPIYPKVTLEAKLFAKYLLKYKPEAKVGILYVNTDYGKNYMNAFKEELGDRADTMITKAMAINPTDTSMQLQIQVLKNSGADTFLHLANGKLAIPTVKQVHDSGWKPLLLLPYTLVIKDEIRASAGHDDAAAKELLKKLNGAISGGITKDPSDPRWKDDKGVKDFVTFMQEYYPEGDIHQKINMFAYFQGQLLIEVLRKAGDNLTRENIMRVATNLDYTADDFPVFLPGLRVHTTPTDYDILPVIKLTQYNGEVWAPLDVDLAK